jgi:hypothetical protein
VLDHAVQFQQHRFAPSWPRGRHPRPARGPGVSRRRPRP